MASAQEQRHSSASSSSSKASTSTARRSRRRTKWTHEELMLSLSIISNLPAPPAPELPPSPPVSRSNSPAPGSKRKATVGDSDRGKRSRTSAMPDRPPHNRPPAAPAQSSSHSRSANAQLNLRSEPSEDGEVREETTTSSSSHTRAKSPAPASVLASTMPIRRPRKASPQNPYYDELHRKYYEIGRAFKYSGDARFWSTYPATHREYRPLPKPPPVNSPYHKFGGLIARLELMDALVCFTYSLWNKEYARHACFIDTWQTAAAFLTWCKTKWQSDPQGERETAFQGLILMIEGFILARKVKFQARGESKRIDKLWQDTRSSMHTAARDEGSKLSAGLLSSGSSHLTPQGLPSPANSAPTTSAQSTPTNMADRAHEGGASAHSLHGLSPNVPPSLPPFPIEFMDAEFPRTPTGERATEAMKVSASKVTVEVSLNLINHIHNQSQWLLQAQTCLKDAEKTLNLPKLAKNFPVTFSRMIHSSLGPDEEFQPDMEDEEGELYWPGQCVSGEGLGWLCLMGKAMINEFGKDIGYIGLKGIIPKPHAAAPSGSQRGQPQR